MRFLTIAGIFTVMFSLASGLVFAEHVIDDSNNRGYLLVISGTSGSLKGDTLTLKGVPNVLYFSDRPNRIAGHKSLTDFVGYWNKSTESFKSDPPNAILSFMDGENVKNVEVELMSALAQDDSVSFKIRVLEGRMPDKFEAASLFVDSYCPWCFKSTAP